MARTLEWISAGDHTLMRRLHRWRAPRWIRLWLLCATRGGDGWLWYAMALVLAVYGGDNRGRALFAASIASASGIVVFLALKRLTGRRRPCQIEPHCWATLLPPDQFSFPSGHTITSFSIAVPLIQYYPDLTIGLLFCAFSIAISRIVLGMHFLSDVLAGLVIGVGLGSGAYWLVG